MDDSLSQQLLNTFDTASLLLVFVTVLFGLRYPEIQKDLSAEIPPGDLAKARHRDKLRDSVLVRCLPMLVINGISGYLFTPLLVENWRTSTFNLWHFDFGRTSYVLISLLIDGFFLWSLLLTARLLKRRSKSR